MLTSSGFSSLPRPLFTFYLPLFFTVTGSSTASPEETKSGSGSSSIQSSPLSPGGKAELDELREDADLKIILLGDSAVGKSKLVERFLMDNFQPMQLVRFTLQLMILLFSHPFLIMYFMIIFIIELLPSYDIILSYSSLLLLLIFSPFPFPLHSHSSQRML